MRISTLILLFFLGTLTLLAARTRSEYPVGCALRVTSSFSPTGKVAQYRYAGYLEAIEVIYHSTMTAQAKDDAIQTLLASVEVDKYVAAVQP